MEYEYRRTWPITDPDMPIVDLVAEALADATTALARLGTRHGLHRVTPWTKTVTHGAPPTLTLSCQVAQRAQVAA